CTETPDPLDCLARGHDGLGNRVVARGVQRDDLLQNDRFALCELGVQLLRHIVALTDRTSLRLDQVLAYIRAQARCLGHLKFGLRGPYTKIYAVLSSAAACDRLEMLLVELAVEPRAVVHHATVDSRADGQTSRPVLGGERELEA